jgi:hypothetical protein
MHDEGTAAPDPNEFGKDVGTFAGLNGIISTRQNNKPFLFPIKRLFYSRKFMVLLFDVIVSTVLYFVGKYSNSSISADIEFLIGSYQPVILIMIYTIAQEDIAGV